MESLAALRSLQMSKISWQTKPVGPVPKNRLPAVPTDRQVTAINRSSALFLDFRSRGIGNGQLNLVPDHLDFKGRAPFHAQNASHGFWQNNPSEIIHCRRQFHSITLAMTLKMSKFMCLGQNGAKLRNQRLVIVIVFVIVIFSASFDYD
jgi:hypothetical protein